MFKIEGLEEMKRGLQKLADNVRALEGEHSAPLSELFPPPFMHVNSRFATIEEMLEAKGIGDLEAFERLPEEEWDRFVAETTRFQSWEEMKNEAAEAWVVSRLGL